MRAWEVSDDQAIGKSDRHTIRLASQLNGSELNGYAWAVLSLDRPRIEFILTQAAVAGGLAGYTDRFYRITFQAKWFYALPAITHAEGNYTHEFLDAVSEAEDQEGWVVLPASWQPPQHQYMTKIDCPNIALGGNDFLFEGRDARGGYIETNALDYTRLRRFYVDLIQMDTVEVTKDTGRQRSIVLDG